MSQAEKSVRIGAGWVSETCNGNSMISGNFQLKIPGIPGLEDKIVTIRFAGFPNGLKKEDDHPDMIFMPKGDLPQKMISLRSLRTKDLKC